MTPKELEANYRSLPVEQLLELTTEMADLLPEARTALLAELHRRGKAQADIEQYAAEQRGEGPVAEPPAGEAPRDRVPDEPGEPERNREQGRSYSYLREGPLPADWVRIPRFGIEEAIGVADCMEQCRIPFQIEQDAGAERSPCLLAVPQERFSESIDALKEYYGLLDEPPKPFTEDCPACGTKLEGATTCPACGLVLGEDAWAAMRGHPFAEFLIQNGLGRRQGDASPPAAGDGAR